MYRYLILTLNPIYFAGVVETRVAGPLDGTAIQLYIRGARRNISRPEHSVYNKPTWRTGDGNKKSERREKPKLKWSHALVMAIPRTRGRNEGGKRYLRTWKCPHVFVCPRMWVTVCDFDGQQQMFLVFSYGLDVRAHLEDFGWLSQYIVASYLLDFVFNDGQWSRVLVQHFPSLKSSVKKKLKKLNKLNKQLSKCNALQTKKKYFGA